MLIFKLNRIVHDSPMFPHFKPLGVRGYHLEQIVLTPDEFETFRLASQMGLSHAFEANEMEISPSAFFRLIEKARKKIADLIILGRAQPIGGSTVHFRANIIQSKDYGHMLISN